MDTEHKDPTALTVAQLAEVCQKLIERGNGDLPVWIAYGATVEHAHSTSFDTRNRYGWAGLYIEGH